MPAIKSLRTRLLVLLVPPVMLAIAALTLLAVTKATSNEKTARYDEMARTAAVQANSFDAQVKREQAIGHTLAATMEGWKGTDRDAVISMLYAVKHANPQVIGTYVGYDPNTFDGADAEHRNGPGADKAGRFGPYVNMLTGKLTLDPLMDQETSEYWNAPKTTLHDSVIEPYLYDGVLMTSYTSPIVLHGKFVGIGGVDRALTSLDKEVSRVRVLKSGYGFLVSRTGIFVASPDKRLIGKQTLGKLGAAKKNAVLQRAAADISHGKAGQAETKDPITGKDVVLSWAPVADGHWGFVTVAPIAEVLAPVHHLRTLLILFGLLAAALVAVAILWVASRLTRPIVEVTEAAERLAQGDVDVVVEARTEDEVGRLALAFGSTVEYLREKAAAADAVAGGDLTVDVEPRSERDALGHAFQRLTSDLRGIVGRVSSTATAVSAASEQMAATSDEAGKAVTEIASAVGEVAQGAERQVRMVESTRDAVQEAARAAADSAETAQETARAALEARTVAREGVGPRARRPRRCASSPAPPSRSASP
jgi:methyl-accepting chemotaxis protein